MSVQAYDGGHPAAKGPGAPTGNELRVIEAGQYTTVTRSTTPATAGGTIATLALGDKLFIQNLNGTDPLRVKKGASAAANSYDYLLAAGDADDDGKGGVVEITDFVGVVSVHGGTYRFVWHQSQA